MPVSFKEILDAFGFLDATGGYNYRAVLCRETGKIYTHSDHPDFEDLNDELPDDVDDEEKYVDIPDKRELDLGKPLAIAFVDEFLPRDSGEVRRIFSRRGAYRNFKALLIRRNARDRWYEYESQAAEKALRDWCEVNSIELTE
ncbi:hypothetical protein [Bradyrhizobium sp.]|uniref:hypothetical protein n=1 Tax=Bradyrhizobium sp. TaxID=376 RepID=UPI004037F788